MEEAAKEDLEPVMQDRGLPLGVFRGLKARGSVSLGFLFGGALGLGGLRFQGWA